MSNNKSIVSMADHSCTLKKASRKASAHVAAKMEQKNKTKKPSRRVTFTATKKERFLRELAQSCNVLQSAEQVHVSVDTVYRHRKIDANFRREWAEAIEIAYDELMLEMLRRARFGTKKPIIYGGKQVGIFNDLNDTMAMRLLSMHMANVAQHKEEKLMDMSNDTHILLMQRLADIKKRLQPPPETKSADKAPIEKK